MKLYELFTQYICEYQHFVDEQDPLARKYHSDEEWEAMRKKQDSLLRSLPEYITFSPEDSLRAKALVFYATYYHKTPDGFHDGYTTHTITVKILTNDIRVSVTGFNKNGIRNHLKELVYQTLTEEVSQ